MRESCSMPKPWFFDRVDTLAEVVSETIGKTIHVSPLACRKAQICRTPRDDKSLVYCSTDPHFTLQEVG